MVVLKFVLINKCFSKICLRAIATFFRALLVFKRKVFRQLEIRSYRNTKMHMKIGKKHRLNSN